jgi:hypothetical protein
VLFAQEKIAVIDGALYAYFTNDAGIMNQKWKPGRLDILEAIEQQISFFTTMGYRQIAYQRASEYVANICSQLQYISQMQDCLEQKNMPGSVETSCVTAFVNTNGGDISICWITMKHTKWPGLGR